MNSWWLLFLIILILAVLLPMALSGILFAPWVPTRKKDLKRILRIAQPKEGEVFYELGSGNGRVCFFIAKNSKTRVVGVELVWVLYLFSQIKRFFVRYRKRIRFKCADLFKEDLSRADIVFIFGMPHSIEAKLKEKFGRELKPGARVVSYTFSIPGWQEKQLDKPEEDDISIYLYER